MKRGTRRAAAHAARARTLSVSQAASHVVAISRGMRGCRVRTRGTLERDARLRRADSAGCSGGAGRASTGPAPTTGPVAYRACWGR